MSERLKDGLPTMGFLERKASEHWPRRILVLALLCGLTLALYPLTTRLLLGTWTFPFDDPWIHQVYARNLAQQGQYAFNLGEPSSGSSAPLWTLLLTPAHLLGIPPVAWALGLGLLSLGLLGAISWEWAQRHFPRPIPLLLTSAIVLTPQVGWTGVEGMETALVAALSLLLLRQLDRPRPVTVGSSLGEGLLSGLLLWLRPEAPLLTVIVLGRRCRAGWRHLLALAGGFVILAGPYVGFHLAIGGRPLPQTVYAKVAYYGGPATLATIGQFLGNLVLTFAPGPTLLVVLLIPLAIRHMQGQGRWTWAPGLLWAGATLTLAALRLPAVLHFGRHFAPVLPVLILAGGEALQGLPPMGRQGLLILGGCLLLIGMVIGVSFYLPACRGILNSQIALGRWIEANLPPGTPVATHDIGAIGYFGHRPVVDTLALITPELTRIVAERDTAGLLGYLQQHGVRYLATLEGIYDPIRQRPDVELAVKRGRMELYHLPR